MKKELFVLCVALGAASCAADLGGEPVDLALEAQAIAGPPLGFPVGEQVIQGAVTWQKFTYGYVTYKEGDGSIQYVGGKSDPAQAAMAARYGKLFDYPTGLNRWPLATNIACVNPATNSPFVCNTSTSGYIVHTQSAGPDDGDATIVAKKGATTAFLVDGPIQDKWTSLYPDPAALGALGYPTAEAVIVDSSHRYQTFENGIIIWEADKGTRVVPIGPVFDTWQRIGVNDFFLGKSFTTDDHLDGSLGFEFGQIVANGTTGAWAIAGGQSSSEAHAETNTLGAYSLPAGSTATPLFFPKKLAAGDMLIVDNCTSATPHAGETKIELGVYIGGGPWPTYVLESTTGCGETGGARLTYVAGKSENVIVRVSAEPGSAASGTVASTVVYGLSNPRPSGVEAIFANLVTHGTYMSADGKGEPRGMDDAYHHFQGVARLNYRRHWDLAFTGAVEDEPLSNFWLVKLGSKDVGDGQLFGGTHNSTLDSVTKSMWLGTGMTYDHGGGLASVGPYLFTGLEKINVNDAFELVGVDTRFEEPREVVLFTGNGGGTLVAATYLPRAPKVPETYRNAYLMLVPGSGSAKWRVYVKFPDGDGRNDPLQPDWLAWGCMNRNGGDDPACPGWETESEIEGGDVSTDDYQSATLITQDDGALYLAAYSADYSGLAADDWLDLWRIVWPGQAMPSGAPCEHPVMCMVKTDKHHMYTTGILTEHYEFNYISFDAGASMYIVPDRQELWTYSVKYGMTSSDIEFNEF